ncbi:unnamed protein product [Staurois parvus]|uniref:Uncharacterized protein n=1 Tax=Staurois parvus TaxID=386267 RepID=A0ABN9GEE1_9NEOB|nr:unnamed protein product [Staurois parvus]
MRGDQRVNCVQGLCVCVCVCVFHCNRTAGWLDGCAVCLS